MSDGFGCNCHASCAAECCCEDVDWTPKEVYELMWKNRMQAEQIVMLRDLIDHILNTYHVPRVPRIMEALDATADLSGSILCDAKPADHQYFSEGKWYQVTDNQHYESLRDSGRWSTRAVYIAKEKS